MHIFSSTSNKGFCELKAQGFTLIEVMIVVAIMGILAAIAIPFYGDYVTRGKIPEATAMLSSKRVQMEQYFQDNRKYATAALPCTADPASANFSYQCDDVTNTTYTIKAIGTGSMSGFTYTIDQSNVKTTAINSSTKPQWHTELRSCWVAKAGDGCGSLITTGADTSGS